MAHRDIPGTYVYDGARSMRGHRLNQFCLSLRDASNRERFRHDERAYLAAWDLPPRQRDAVLRRDWLVLLDEGLNIFVGAMLGRIDGLSMQAIGGQMTGMTEDEFRAMLRAGQHPTASGDAPEEAGGG